MSVSLLDINVLIALFWPAHGSHKSAHKWFAKHAGSRWATCSFTQAGFVRIVSNPKFSPAAVSPKEAIGILAANLQNPNHVFWSDTRGFVETTAAFTSRIRGHQQVSDAYLLGLTRSHRGTLVTFDRAIATLGGDQIAVEVI